MSDDHPHSHDEPDHTHGPENPVDAGSQALSEALRSSFKVIKFVLFLLILLFLASGYFTVQPNERAIILRFGKPVGEGQKALLSPGPHWSYPYPIDEVKKVSVTGIQRVDSTVGWWATTPELELTGADQQTMTVSINPAVDGYTLSSDLNIIHTRATLYYRIENPIRYVFGFANASNMVQGVLNNALVYASANFKVDDILTRDKAGFQGAVRERVMDLLQKEDLGIAVDNCTVESAAPRQQTVREAFVSVLNAQINRDKLLQDAGSDTNKVLTAAVASSNAIVNIAELERVQLVNDLASRATNFVEILPTYQANRNLFVQQRFNETLSRALTNVQDKIFLSQRADGKPRDLWLMLNREPKVPISNK